MTRERLPEHTERATTVCRNAKSGSKQYEILDGKVPGLELRVNSSGKEWSLRYRVKVGEKWQNRRSPLGEFPTVSVANARAAAQQLKADISRGADPMGLRRKEIERRAEEVKANAKAEAAKKTVQEVFETWMASDKPRNRVDNGAELRRLFQADVLPKLGQKQITDVTQADIYGITDQILARGSNRMAQSTLSELKQFFAYATLRQIISVSPAEKIKKSDIGRQPQSRERVLDPLEIRALDQALHASSLNRVTHIIYMLQIALTCRINELCQAAWSEIDWVNREWTIPAEKNKSRRPITVALSLYSLHLLSELHSLTGHTKWLYPGRDESKPVNRKQATNHARDRQLPEGRPPVNGRTVQTRSLVIGRERWVTHDLRRSGVTLMQKMGISTDVSDRCLNHAESDKIKKIYHMHNYDKEMKKAWYLLSEALYVITGTEGEKFFQACLKDESMDLEDQEGLLALIKQHYIKPDAPQEPAW